MVLFLTFTILHCTIFDFIIQVFVLSLIWTLSAAIWSWTADSSSSFRSLTFKILLKWTWQYYSQSCKRWKFVFNTHPATWHSAAWPAWPRPPMKIDCKNCQFLVIKDYVIFHKLPGQGSMLQLFICSEKSFCLSSVSCPTHFGLYAKL